MPPVRPAVKPARRRRCGAASRLTECRTRHDDGVLAHFAPGGYRFLVAPGAPFSAGIIADPGHDLVHAILHRPLVLSEGLEAARRHVESAGRPAPALAGFELRIPEPLDREGFDAFNAPYVRRMTAMGLTSGNELVSARTNVSPMMPGIGEPAVYAFTYTVPGRGRPHPAFRLSGATETRGGSPGDRLRSIVDVLEERMGELGVDWHDATAVNVYGAEGTAAGLEPDVLERLGPAGLHGLTWYPSLPPIRDFDFEIDVRGVGSELTI